MPTFIELVTDSSHEMSWPLLIAQGLGGLGIIIAAWIKFLPKLKGLLVRRKDKKNKEAILRSSRALRLTRLLMRDWRLKYGSQRVLLLYAKNGNKPWHKTDKVKMSCLEQSVDEATEDNTWGDWQDWQIDPPYRELLSDLIVSEETSRGILVTKDSLPEGVLKNAYREEGTEASVLIPLSWVSEECGLVYISLNFGENLKGAENLTDEQKVTYEDLARDLYNKPNEIRKMIYLARDSWKNTV